MCLHWAVCLLWWVELTSSLVPQVIPKVQVKKSPLFCTCKIYLLYQPQLIWGLWLQIWIQNFQIISCVENKKFQCFHLGTSYGSVHPIPCHGLVYLKSFFLEKGTPTTVHEGLVSPLSAEIEFPGQNSHGSTSHQTIQRMTRDTF